MLVQQITPEVIGWIRAQARAGHGREAVMRAMRDKGWQDQIAQAAVAEASSSARDELPAPNPVPEPDLAQSPSSLRLSDREVQVLAEMRLPRVVVFGGFLSSTECDELIESAREQLTRSSVVDHWSGGSADSAYRTSDGTFFDRGAGDTV